MNPTNPVSIEAPTTVTATSTDTGTQVITWTPATDAVGYEVSIATNQAGPYTQLTDTTATSYTVTGLNPNTTYYYQVTAYDNNQRAASTPIAAVTPATGQPANVTATTTTTTATLNWAAVTGATTYRIATSPTEDGTFNVVARVDAPATTYTLTGLTPNTANYYKVLSYTGNTLTSASDPILVTTEARAINTPTDLNAIADSPTTVSLTWNPPTGDIEGYRIYRATTNTGPYTLIMNTNVQNYMDTGLTPNTTYYYTVEAYNGATTSPQTAPVTVTTPLQREDQLYGYDMQNRCVRLVWILENEPETITVERSTIQGGPYTTLATVDGATNTYQDCTARHGYIYYYRLTYADGATTTFVGPVRVRVPSDPIYIDPQPLCGATIVTRQTTCCQPVTCCQPTCCNPCCNNNYW